jgi:hypothetical protein
MDRDLFMASSKIFDEQNMGKKVKESLKKCRQGVRIFPLAKIAVLEPVEVGDHSRIDDLTLEH